MNSSLGCLLVTGASGFLGSEVVSLARAAGWRVRTLVRNSQTQMECADTFRGDISDPSVLQKACEGVSAVVHAAGLAHVFGRRAKDWTNFNAINETGTANLVDAAVNAGVSQIVLASSVAVYGMHTNEKCDEKTPCTPQGPYATSKWRGEIKAAESIANWPGSLRILRLATIYGEGDRGNVARLIHAIKRGRFIWPGPSLNQKSLIYKTDAARSCLRALQRPVSGCEIFNVSAQPVSMREIVTSICEALGRPAPRLQVPSTLLRTAEAILGGPHHVGAWSQQLQKLIRDDVYDASKFEAAFDFHPAMSLSEGLRRQVNSIQSHTM
jgi:nucleoside-diphosphate-sugar epimerase